MKEGEGGVSKYRQAADLSRWGTIPKREKSRKGVLFEGGVTIKDRKAVTSLSKRGLRLVRRYWGNNQWGMETLK